MSKQNGFSGKEHTRWVCSPGKITNLKKIMDDPQEIQKYLKQYKNKTELIQQINNSSFLAFRPFLTGAKM